MKLPYYLILLSLILGMFSPLHVGAITLLTTSSTTPEDYLLIQQLRERIKGLQLQVIELANQLIALYREKLAPDPLYPSYLPEGLTVDGYRYVDGVWKVDVVGGFGVLTIRQFDSSYDSGVTVYDDLPTFQHLITTQESILASGGSGTYYDLGTLPPARNLFLEIGDIDIRMYCYGTCKLSKDEFLKVADSFR